MKNGASLYDVPFTLYVKKMFGNINKIIEIHLKMGKNIV